MNGTEIERHLSDGDLLRYIDGDAAADDRRRWHRHVEDCPRCAGDIRSLERDSRLLSDWLDRASFEAASRRPRSMSLAPWARAAAILVLMAAPVAAIPAVRSWVVEWVVGGEDAAVADLAHASAADESTVLRFVPAAGELEVRFDSEVQGSISIHRSMEPEAMLTSIGGAPEAVVSASMLQIRNPQPGRYQLRVPARTTELRIRIGDRTVAVTGSRIDRGTTVELEPR